MFTSITSIHIINSYHWGNRFVATPATIPKAKTFPVITGQTPM